MFTSFSAVASPAASTTYYPPPSTYTYPPYNSYWDPASSSYHTYPAPPPSIQQVHPSVHPTGNSTSASYLTPTPYATADATHPLFRVALGDSTAAANYTPYNGTPASIYIDPDTARKRKASTTTPASGGAPRASKRAQRASAPSTTASAPPAASSTAPAAHGVGPATAPAKPTPPENPARPTQCAGSHLAKDRSRNSGATDVWYNVRGGGPADGVAPQTVEEEREKTRPSPEKYSRLVCRLCPAHSAKHWANTKGMTDTIRSHMADKHESVWRDIVVKLELKGYDLPYDMKDGTPHRPRESLPYSKDVLRDKLLRWLAVDDQSINVVDSEEFRDLVFFLKPDMDENDLPHRTKMTELIQERYEKEFQCMKDEIQNSPGRVAFTMDVWTRVNLESYLAVTAHYIDTTPAGKDVLKARLVAFHYLQGSHTGENIGKAFVSVAERLGCLHKISSITLDNASNNGTCMEEVARELAKLKIPFDVQGNRIRCFPHVVNIAVKAGIKALDDLAFYDYSEFFNPTGMVKPFELVSDPAYEAALKSDVVGKARKLVNAVRASGQRREAFEKTIKTQNGLGGWGDPPALLRVVGLLRDVDTRWSSTLVMIDRLLELYLAVNEFINSSEYKAELAAYALDEAAYRVLLDLRTFLQFLNSVQEIVSGQQTPTLSVVLPLYEKLITGLRYLMTPGQEESVPKLSHAIQATIDKLEEYLSKSRQTRLYALAMVINPTVKFEWFTESSSFSSAECAEVRQYTRDAMLEFRRHLRGNAASPPQPPAAPTRATVPTAHNSAARNLSSGINRFDAMFNKLSRSQSTSSVGSEISSAGASSPETGPEAEALARQEDERIVDAELLAWEQAGREQTSYIDLVAFWQVNKHKYPHLYRIALDVMPVQASAVPCERVFSSSKETDALRRANLSPRVMECLQVLKYIFRSDRLDAAFGMSELVCTEQELTVIDLETSLLEDMISQGRVAELEQLIVASHVSYDASQRDTSPLPSPPP